MSTFQYSASLCYNSYFSNTWQFIYGSQLYGTLFGIYAKFHGNEDTINSIEFQLRNYKGIINLGIETVFEHKNGYSYTVIIQGLSNDRHYPISLSKPISFSKNQCKEIKIYRFLIPFGFSKGFEGEVFDTEYFFREGFRTEDVAYFPKPGILDSYDDYQLDDYPGLHNYLIENVKFPPNFPTPIDSNIAALFPGFRCIRSNAIIASF